MNRFLIDPTSPWWTGDGRIYILANGRGIFSIKKWRKWPIGSFKFSGAKGHKFGAQMSDFLAQIVLSSGPIWVLQCRTVSCFALIFFLLLIVVWRNCKLLKNNYFSDKENNNKMSTTTTKIIMICKVRTHDFCHTTTTADGHANTEPH